MLVTFGHLNYYYILFIIQIKLLIRTSCHNSNKGQVSWENQQRELET